MVDVLAKELSDALQQSQSFRATDPTLSQLSNDEIIRSATETMENYEKHEQFCAVIDSQRKQTIRGLIHLLEFRSLYEKGHYGQALQLLEYINVIPLTEDFYHMQLLVSQFNTLDETIKKNIPELLLNAMDILYKIWDAQSSNLSTPTAVSSFDVVEMFHSNTLCRKLKPWNVKYALC
jgi:nuclear pore complex protein Nup93